MVSVHVGVSVGRSLTISISTLVNTILHKKGLLVLSENLVSIQVKCSAPCSETYRVRLPKNEPLSSF